MEDKKYENEKRKLKPFQITVLVLIIILVLILLSIFWFISGKWGKVNKVDLNKEDIAVSTGVEDNLANFRNVAILGIDSREDTYSKGNITGQAGGGIVGFKESGTIKNSYYLENIISGNESINEGAKSVSDSLLKDIYTSLGDAFKQDIDNINDGYPILSWQ